MWEDEGFAPKNDQNVEAAMHQLEVHIKYIKVNVNKYSQNEWLQKPSAKKWSKQEILGHLIDSAINNLKRFTEVQFMPQPYVVVPYQQENLVVLNHYQDLPIRQVVNLLVLLNEQIKIVLTNIAAKKLKYKVVPQYASTDEKTLAWLICDYVAHMSHHLKAI